MVEMSNFSFFLCRSGPTSERWAGRTVFSFIYTSRTLHSDERRMRMCHRKLIIIHFHLQCLCRMLKWSRLRRWRVSHINCSKLSRCDGRVSFTGKSYISYNRKLDFVIKLVSFTTRRLYFFTEWISPTGSNRSQHMWEWFFVVLDVNTGNLIDTGTYQYNISFIPAATHTLDLLQGARVVQHHFLSAPGLLLHVVIQITGVTHKVHTTTLCHEFWRSGHLQALHLHPLRTSQHPPYPL